MNKVTDQIWTGDSKDAEHADLRKHGITSMLNVAHDLQCKRGWSDGIEYAQCGLIDGPGTPQAAYHAAVMKLVALAKNGAVLVVDHKNGGRALFTVIAYLNLVNQRRGWDGWLKLIGEKRDLPNGLIHEAHYHAFMKLNWRLLASVIND